MFGSSATNLVAGDTNSVNDVFLHDTQTGATTRVSVDSLGVESDGFSDGVSISANGRYITFYSEATNLITGDTNGFSDVFLHDTQTGTTTRVSVDSLGVEGDSSSSTSSISSSGRYIFFTSDATNFTSEDDNAQTDVFLHDTQTGDTTLINPYTANGGSSISSYANSISSDGRYVVFSSSASNFVLNDINSSSDIFFYDTQDLELNTISISNDPQTTTFQVNDDIYYTQMSGNGQYITFVSDASNIVLNDFNNANDIFLYNIQTQQTDIVSVSSSEEVGNGASIGGSISNDGRYIAFYSTSSNLVPGTSGFNYYLRDTQGGTTTVVSVDSLGDPLNAGSPFGNVRISGNGRYVVYDSHPSVSLPGGSIYGAYRYDTQTGTTIRVAVDSSGDSVSGSVVSISQDGRYVFFVTDVNGVVPEDMNGFSDVFMYDAQTDTVSLISVGSGGDVGNADSGTAILSDDGQYVYFESLASNLVVGDLNGEVDIFRRETQTGEVTKISNNLSLTGMYLYGVFNQNPTISSDNRYLSYGARVFDLETGVVAQIAGVSVSGNIYISKNTKRLSFASSQSYVLPDTGVMDNFYSTYAFVLLDYSGNFVESTSNNGTLTGSRTITITDDTFVNASGTLTLNTHYTLTNAPAGLTPVMTVSSDGLTATLTFTGSATTHANANDVSNLTITFLDDAFTLESDADQVAGATNSAGTINFQDPNGGSSGGGGSNPNPVPGCTDSDADNYNPSATQDNGSCQYAPGAIVGCTDISAGNYNSQATVDNGTCLYGVFGCMDATATNYNPLAVYSNGSCTYLPPPIDPPSDDPDDVNGCMDPGALNYNPLATVNSLPCDYLIPVTLGCMDVTATNYNEEATTDDGSCTYTPPPPEEEGEGLPPITSIIGFIERTPEVPIAIAITGLALPLITPFISPGNIAGIVSIPLRLWNLIPTLLGFRRKKRPWGTVYDSVTKQPLDPVYVMLKDASGNEVATSITDLDGRYGFQVSPGQYTLFANKANYVFPSAKLAGKTEDDLYNNLYFGDLLSVQSEDEIINKNIPMDAINFNWNEFEKAKNKKLMKFYSQTELFLARISKVLFFAGLVSSIALTILEPKTFNFVILGLYALILVLAFFGIKPRAFGFVTEKETGYPLSFAVISIFSSELGREVAHTVIGKTGRYYLLVPKGTYFIKLRKKTGENTYEEVYQSESFTANKGYINKIIKI